ncbi:MAG: hypothetical protein EBX49_05535 [Synechococcaceae bacterium WB8_1B_136]|nr:hypothetical protein [Synechococcaceae bacterium WB8_1B_136]
MPLVCGHPRLRLTSPPLMASPSPQWVNTPVLLEALSRYEQGRLPRSMQLWLQAVLELDQPVRGPLRPHC